MVFSHTDTHTKNALARQNEKLPGDESGRLYFAEFWVNM